MKKTKLLISAVLLSAAVCLLTGCFSRFREEFVGTRQETYCIVSLSPTRFKPLNAHLYALSHEHGVGVYIIDDFAPRAPDGAGNVPYSEDAYAEQVYAAYDRLLAPFEDSVLLAVGNNVLAFGEGGEPFADIAANGRMRDVLTDEIRAELSDGIVTAMREALDAGQYAENTKELSSEVYESILYDFAEKLTPHLEDVSE